MEDAIKQAYAPDHRVERWPSPKRIRTLIDGEVVADSRRALLVREAGSLPVYYFPREDVLRADWLENSDHTSQCPHKGHATYWHISSGRRRIDNAAWAYVDAVDDGLDLGGYIAFHWNKMDAWFEEDEEVFVHPRDPFKRVDVLESSRRVEVVIAGSTVADSERPLILFETGLPPRYYLPKLDVRMEALRPSERLTRCPYKGEARYYSVAIDGAVAEDVAWYYRYPTLEVARIANYVCFYDERVDELRLDGVVQQKPKTPWA